MNILLTGATGFIGKSLCLTLAEEGHQLTVLTQDMESAEFLIPAPHKSIQWPTEKILSGEELNLLNQIDAIIYLAGEPIAGSRWNAAVKKKIYDSRVKGTQDLIELFQKQNINPPSVWISASAVGFYGDAGDRNLTEADPVGKDFLAEVCRDWEKAVADAPFPKMRKISLRFGVVLAKGGGALAEMVPPFLSGMGGKLGNGKQWTSWIHRDDLIAIILECLKNPEMNGVYNACAPEPVTNCDFTHSLARVIRCPSWLPIPGFMLRLVAGEVANVLLSSQRTIPQRLNSQGFKFSYPRLDHALNEIFADSLSIGFEEVVRDQWLPLPIEKVFDFFSSAENLETITPEWLNFSIERKSTEKIEKGTLIDYRLHLNGVPFTWKTEITDWSPPYHFTDLQLKGPYSYWNHNHHFRALQGGTLIQDHVYYCLPMKTLGRAVAANSVRKRLQKVFAFRAKKIAEILKA